MANFFDYDAHYEAEPEKMTGEERRALLLCMGGVVSVFGLLVFLSKYLYLL